MPGYAVVDLQTTGLDPRRHDRVVEVGVVVLDERAHVVDEWCTLVDPGRDVGPTALHGITARDVVGAPTFADVAGPLLEAVDGRLVVAHNAPFDLLFLVAELRRAGLPLVELDPVPLCTMALAAVCLPASGRSLASCCDAAGIPRPVRFSSRDQARATARLLAHCIQVSGGTSLWEERYEGAGRYRWPHPPPSRGALVARERTAAPTASPVWLDRVIAQMPRAGDPDVEPYLAGLEAALLDRYLSRREEESLVALAGLLGIDRQRLTEVHRRYLVTMAAVALADGVVTADERADLEQVARLLGLGDQTVSEALDLAASEVGATTATPFRLRPGDAVCFTGATRTPRAELEQAARAAGLEAGGLTRRTRLLVAADPDTSSGKGRKAVQYGVPIITEDAFLRLLGGGGPSAE